ncbi:MAG: GAF domain-containing protein, partial [Anaerolineales bacterium]
MLSLKLASAERRATLLHAAAQVAKSITTIHDIERLLNQAVDIICDEFDFYYAGVFLLDKAGEYAVLHAGRGDAGQVMISEGHKLVVGGDSMIGAATGNREARIALDVGEEAAHFKNPHLPHTRSEMALPLMVAGEVAGALTVQSVEEAAFTQEDITTLQSMADQLAIAIQNARLHEENRALLKQEARRARLFKAANEVGHRLTTLLNLDELLPKTVDVICDAYGFYYAGVFLLDETGGWAVLRAGRGEAGQKMIEAGHRLEVGGHSMIGAAVSWREARIALDVGEEPVHFKNPFLPHTRSEMALPLIVGDTVLGAVTVQSVEEAAFSQDDITTLQTMADHLAIAIHNAYLLRELEMAHAALLRAKTYEALATATIQAIHWIGNKALPITTTVVRMRADLDADEIDVESLKEDLEMINISARLIVDVKETIIGPARDQNLRPAMVADVVQASAFHTNVLDEMLTINVAPDTPLALTDTTQLARALSFLFKNAMEARATHISANVTPTLDRAHVAISIADDGIGIPPDISDKIWAAFFTTKGAHHSGLGLSACLHTLTQMDGRIAVDSKPGQGATFTIVLPAAPDDEAIDLSGAPQNIFFVDEADDTWALFAANVIKLAGKNVIVEESPAGAAEADLILIDEA